MSQVGTKLRKASGQGERMLIHWCPGCFEAHSIRIEGKAPVWSFDGNYAQPTFSPSIRRFYTETTDDDDKPLPAPRDVTTCHYFIKAGKIEFCGDCQHSLTGQTVELPDWPYLPVEYGGLDE